MHRHAGTRDQLGDAFAPRRISDATSTASAGAHAPRATGPLGVDGGARARRRHRRTRMLNTSTMTARRIAGWFTMTDSILGPVPPRLADAAETRRLQNPLPIKTAGIWPGVRALPPPAEEVDAPVEYEHPQHEIIVNFPVRLTNGSTAILNASGSTQQPPWAAQGRTALDSMCSSTRRTPSPGG